jgi:Flp pilus assembly protein TadG
MIARFIRGKENESGATLVEFAFAAPLFLLLLFAVVDFGRAVYDYHLVANAARLGSRYAIVRGTSCPPALSGCAASSLNTNIANYIRSVSPGVDPNSLTVTQNWTNTNECTATQAPLANGPGCVVTVTVSYPFHFVAFPFPQITMSSSSTMVISQ